MDIILIACVDKAWGIAKRGKMAWNIPEETDFFLKTVLQQTDNSKNGYIIARKSWEADFPKSRLKILAHCDVFCLTKAGKFNVPEKQRGKPSTSLDHALSGIRSTPNPPQRVFICGGISLYKEAFMRGIVNKCILSFLPDDYRCDMHLHFIRDNLPNQFNKISTDATHSNFHVEYWGKKPHLANT